MRIWPAIDILNGKCVRLVQGDYDRETVYGEDPVENAREWIEAGAQCLHIVDLNAARDGVSDDGRSGNLDVIVAMAEAVDVPVQVGGGIRDERTISTFLEHGIKRLIAGTRAAKDPSWAIDIANKYPESLLVGIDARDGMVATDGWTETSSMPAIEFARSMAEHPIAGIIYTDISKDGMLEGPNLAAMAEMKDAVNVPVIASGGVTTAGDVADLAKRKLAGCIVGRALYEGRLTIKQAIDAAAGVSTI